MLLMLMLGSLMLIYSCVDQCSYILQLNGALKKLVTTIYRMKISGIIFELWSFSPFCRESPCIYGPFLRSLIETVERYRRQEPDHPNRKLIETWKPVRRIQLKTVLDVAKEMSSMENLPTERELERKFQNVPPWQHLHQPKILTSLLNKKITKEAEPNILKLCAKETVNSYSTSAIHAYTE